MRSTENITQIINTLNYIRLLLEDEQVIELNKIINISKTSIKVRDLVVIIENC